MNEGIYTTIDGDTLPYLLAWKHKDTDDVDLVIKDLDSFVTCLLNNTSATYYAGFLGTSQPTFRHLLATVKPYKGQRPLSPDWYKKWSGPMKAHLRDKWNFQVVNGIEADDAVCIYQTWCRENNKNSIMCHGDKDLYQIEGNHYDIRKHTRKYVSELEANINLYRQVCHGDNSDAITGLVGCGVKGSEKLISHLTRWEDMQNAASEAFCKKHGDNKGMEIYTEMYSLCKLLTHSNELPIVFHEYKREVSIEEPEIDITSIWD